MKSQYLIFLLVVVLVSCSGNISEPPFERNPVEQKIKIQYKYWFGDEINTFDKTLTKDLIIDGKVTIDFWFQEEEQNQLIDIVQETDFWSIKDTLLQNSDSVWIEIDPDPGIQSLTIEYADSLNTVYWFIVNDYEEEYQRIKRITKYIIDVIENDPEYKKLPPRNGTYF